MNTKIRALLWEEIRVGGAIAFVAMLGGLFTQLGLSNALLGLFDGVSSRSNDAFPWIATLGFPLMTLLLLTLNTANSGHMTGGFSKRILRLPVETWSAVLVILLTRLAVVLFVSSLMAAAAWELFGEGPGVDTILILGMAYLLVQVLDWLRDAAIQIVAPVLALLLGLLLLNLNNLAPLLALNRTAAWNPAILLVFVSLATAAYAVSVAAVHYTRRGARLNLLAPFAALRLPHFWQRTPAKPFETPLSAQVWFELRRAGVLLPLVTVFYWVLFIGLGWLIVRNSSHNKPEHMIPTLTYEILPLLAFLAAALTWNLRIAKIRSWGKKRPASYFLRLPVAPIDVARARFIAGFLNFGLVFLVVAVVSRLAFLSIDHGVIFWLLRDAYANGEISGREIAALLVGTPLVIGIAGWCLMYVPRHLITVPLLPFLGLWMFWGMEMPEPFLLAVALVALALPIPWFILECVRARRRGLLPLGSLMACLLMWVAITLAIFPHTSAIVRYHPFLILIACASIAVFPVLPFVSTLLTASGQRIGESATDGASQRGASRHRSVGLGLLLSLLIVVIFVRWTGEPAYKAKLHAEGIPANRMELSAWYPAVPEQRNLAQRYLQADATRKALASRWGSDVVKQEPAANTSPGAVALERLKRVMKAGEADIEDTDIIPLAVWQTTQEYWNQVGAPACDAIHEAAQSGLTESRYPIDIERAEWIKMPHLRSLRELSAQLQLKALMGALEGRPGDIATALSDLNPLAESLKSEPLLMSQLTRVALHGGVPAALETAMHRAIFADADLAQFTSILEHGLPEASNQPMIARGLAGDMIITLDWSENALNAGSLLTATDYDSDPRDFNLSNVLVSALTPAVDALGWTSMERTLTLRNCFMNLDGYREGERLGYLQEEKSEQDNWKEHLFIHSPLSSILRPPFLRATQSEWQLRTRFDVARAALAIERYRIANGRLPERLDELVPQFLDQVPSDFFRERAPLSYRIDENGGYTVYSIGSDRIDDGGTAKYGRDITFNVAPLELRTRPQVL